MLYSKDEKHGSDLCEAAELENKHAEKPAFAHRPLVRPGFAKKVSELKAFNSRSAFLNSHQQEVVIRHT